MQFRLLLAAAISTGLATVFGNVHAQNAPGPSLRIEQVVPTREQPLPSGPARIFADDFENGTDLRARYFEYVPRNDSFVWTTGEGHGGGGAMRCTFQPGQVDAGNLKVVFGRNPFNRGVRRDETFREIFWRVYVKHEAGWQGNPAKLARATCMAGPNWSQGLIAHVWGGKGDSLCIDPATGIRNNEKVSTRYNDFANLRWLGLRNGRIPIFHPSESGRWVCVESQVRLNTPGQQDGQFRLWVDGQLEAERTDLNWHGTWNDYALNAVFLENYWNNGSVKRQSRWFDDFVISTQRIGPTTSDATPVLVRTPSPGVRAWEAEISTDPAGRDIVWRSHRLTAATTAVSATTGTFIGSRRGHSLLAPGTEYWVRVRAVDAEQDSAWSGWHAPFQTHR